jgi:DNA-binding response OmpR family regulator
MDNNSRRKYRILIVDDQVDLASLYRRQLLREGFDVKQADGGESGLVEARSFQPDVILLDLMMPGLSGFDAIDLFRGVKETSASKIIVLSALGSPADIDKARQWGADDYIVKSSTTMEGIIVRVKQALGMATPDGGIAAGS